MSPVHAGRRRITPASSAGRTRSSPPSWSAMPSGSSSSRGASSLRSTRRAEAPGRRRRRARPRGKPGLGLDRHAAQPAAGLRLCRRCRCRCPCSRRARPAKTIRRSSRKRPSGSAAVAHLNARGSEKVAIVSHSMGARMSNYFLTHVAGARVAAWVAIGLPDSRHGARLRQDPGARPARRKGQCGGARQRDARAALLRTIRGSAQVAGRRGRPLLRRPRGRAHAAGEAVSRQAAAPGSAMPLRLQAALEVDRPLGGGAKARWTALRPALIAASRRRTSRPVSRSAVGASFSSPPHRRLEGPPVWIRKLCRLGRGDRPNIRPERRSYREECRR